MIKIGLFVNNIQTFDALINIFKDKFDVLPHRCRKNGYVEYFLPLLHITIILIVEYSCGRRYDLVYYEEENISDEKMNMINACCPYSRPRPLKHFLL